MKKVRIVIIAVVLVGLVCGGFYYMSSKKDVSVENKTELTTLDKLILKDLESNYPSTPRAVVKLYNQIITCYYSAEFKDDEFEKLVDQALLLFDDEIGWAETKLLTTSFNSFILHKLKFSASAPLID